MRWSGGKAYFRELLVRLMRPSEMDSVREIRVFDCQDQLVTDRVVKNWTYEIEISTGAHVSKILFGVQYN